MNGIKDKEKTESFKEIKFVVDRPYQANGEVSDDDKVDTSDNEIDGDFVAQSTEQWGKSVKRKSDSTIKGTYVSPPKKPLFFNPVQNAKDADDLPRRDKKRLFQSFRKDMWSKLPKEMTSITEEIEVQKKDPCEQKKNKKSIEKKITKI